MHGLIVEEKDELLIELIGNRFEERENEKLFSYFYIPDQLHLVVEVHML